MGLTRRQFMKTNGTAAAWLGLGGSFEDIQRISADSSQKKTNILLIVADDMGFSDLGCYGGEITTPNIDGLATNGLRGTQFYNTARCCPSRASLLTGLYPHKTGLGWMTVSDLGKPGYIGELNDHCITIAQGLKANGSRVMQFIPLVKRTGTPDATSANGAGPLSGSPRSDEAAT